MEYSAICHFADKRFCFALEKGRFLFRLQVKRGDIAQVILHVQDKYLPLKYMDTRQAYEMELASSDQFHDYFEAVLEFDVVCLRYYFEIIDVSGKRIFFGNHLFSETPFTDVERMFDCPQNLREEEMFHIPQWAKNKVIYQIFPSRFATSKEVDEQTWYQAPIDYHADLKGDLRGIIEHLDYLQNLGIDVIYLNPIFRSDTSHKYDTIDYYLVDPSFGTKEDLKELVEKAHSRGMRVILDGVFNHTSTKFFAFADIMEKQEQSKYLDWYYIEGFPLIMEWGKKPNFKTFSYAGMMPKLNLRNKEVEDYIIEVASYWIRECDIDGWRLDVGDEITHRFWRRFREEIKAVKQDALIVGEIWHYAGDFLEGDEWDSVMNYQFYNSVMDLVVGESITVSQFAGNLDFMRGNLHPDVIPVLWNLIDSHDTPRISHNCKNQSKKQKLAAAFQLLLPGMPMIYYGDEVGMQGGADPDCRRGMLWDESKQDRSMFVWYQTLIRLRKELPCITEGVVEEVWTDDTRGILVFRRSLQEEEITLVFHCKKGSVELPELVGKKNLLNRRKFSGEVGDYEVVILQ